jgi:hypothetical protein
VLKDVNGDPITDATGLTVVAKMRATSDAETVLHTFATSLVELTIPGLYGGNPVIAAQLNEMSELATAALDFDAAVWDMTVDGEPVVGGPVTLPWVVSRA